MTSSSSLLCSLAISSDSHVIHAQLREALLVRIVGGYTGALESWLLT